MCAEKRTLSIAARSTWLSVVWRKGVRISFGNFSRETGRSATEDSKMTGCILVSREES